MSLRALTLGAALALVAGPAFAADPDCGSADLVKSTVVAVAVCVDPGVWQKAQSSGDPEFFYFSIDGKAAFAIVSEKPGAPLSDYRDGIVAFVEKQSGAAPGSIKPFDETTATINGKIWGSMRYDATVSGSQLEYLTYYYSEDGVGSLQLLFWSLPADADAVKTSFADKIMATVTIDP